MQPVFSPFYTILLLIVNRHKRVASMLLFIRLNGWRHRPGCASLKIDLTRWPVIDCNAPDDRHPPRPSLALFTIAVIINSAAFAFAAHVTVDHYSNHGNKRTGISILKSSGKSKQMLIFKTTTIDLGIGLLLVYTVYLVYTDSFRRKVIELEIKFTWNVCAFRHIEAICRCNSWWEQWLI